MSKKKVFLGGTCNDSKWRDKLIPMLEIDYFNPVVNDWTKELRQREICDYCLYTITPRMLGVYSIAEVVDDSNKRPDKTILCVLKEDDRFPDDEIDAPTLMFSHGQMKSLDKVGVMVENNGGKYFKSLEEVVNYLNNN